MANFLTFAATDVAQADPQIPSEDAVPRWMLGADNHNIGNTKGGSWLDPSTWGEKFEDIGFFAATSVLSGANSFYNTGAAVGNWLGLDTEQRDTSSWITSLDDEWGAYYNENRQAADLAGFIAGSLVPGLAGIKVLNAGQAALKAAAAGQVGKNMSMATKLLVPRTEQYVKLATDEFARTNMAFSLINQNVGKALMSGVWQNTLEAAAFETAVQASMFKSPVLDDQTIGDIAKNIAIGGLVGGTIGGAFNAAKIRYGLKDAIQAEDAAAKFALARDLPADKLSPSERIILAGYDRDMGAIPYRSGTGGEQDAVLFSKDRTNYVDKMRKYNNDIRQNTVKMSGTFPELGNKLADLLEDNAEARLRGAADVSHTTLISNFLHAQEVAPVAAVTKLERIKAKAAKELDIATAESIGFRVIKLYGDDVGVVFDDVPLVYGIADAVLPKAGQTYKEAVLAETKSYSFSTAKQWRPYDLKRLSANIESDARRAWFMNNSKLRDLRTLKEAPKVYHHDIPFLEHVYHTKQWDAVSFVDDAGKEVKIGTQADMLEYIRNMKMDAARQLLLDMVGGKLPLRGGTELIARIVNVNKNMLEGMSFKQATMDDLFFYESQSRKLAEFRHMKLGGGALTPDYANTNVLYEPAYAKVGYMSEQMKNLDGNVVDAITFLKTKEKDYVEAADRVFKAHIGELAANFPDVLDDDLLKTTRYGAGPGLFSFASGSYGSVEEKFILMGNATNKVVQAKKEAVKELLTPSLVKLAQDQKAAIEVANISRQIAATSEHYLYVSGEELAEFGLRELSGEADEVVKGALVSHKVIGALRENAELAAAGKSQLDSGEVADLAMTKLQANAPVQIDFVTEAAEEFAKAHVQANNARTRAMKDMAAVAGKENHRILDAFHPIRADVKDYPFVAFVVDPRVTGSGHVSMLHAHTAEQLDKLIDQVKSNFPEYQVRTKVDTEEFFKARGAYEFDRSLHENYIDADLKRRGIMSEFFIPTDPQKIVDRVLNNHLTQESVTAKELVRTKYQKQFDFLEDQAKQFSNLEASRYGGDIAKVETWEANPYISYMKLGLDITKTTEYPTLFGLNRTLDQATSRVVARVKDMFNGAKTPEELDKINSYLKEVGYNTGLYNAGIDALANHSAPKGELTKFVRTANAVLSRFVLGLDPLNALNNAIGANVLRGAEFTQLTRAIQQADPKLAGKLAELMKVQLPGQSKSLVTSPTKLIAKSVDNFFKDARSANKPLMQTYRNMGVVKNLTEQFYQMLDDFALQGTETVADLNTRTNRAITRARELADAGEKYTGNTLAEEFNRFISADVMRQITDVAVAAKVMTPKEARAYILNAVNRVEGNFIASQRPLIFQGPIGQAMGLFQTYQFNLLQNLFRYVGEGKKKDVAMLMGLQGTLYGLNGLPAFQAINENIIGTASGNTEHKDMYDAVYGIAGKTAGEFLLYGAPSTFLQANLYSRGDINPRQVTILPTRPEQLPIYGAYSRFFDSMFEVATNIKNGAPVWDSFLEGIEHNGLNRPLAGVAQTARAFTNEGVAYSTSTRGTIMYENDLLSWASAVRVAGGKPMDEAIVTDAVFRIQAYAAHDREKRIQLSEAVKLQALTGEIPPEEQVAKFAELYARTGGKQSKFNQWMMEQYKSATTPQAEKILQQLENPLAVKMQLVMGGEEP